MIPENIFNFVMYAEVLKHLDRITVENADDVYWKWTIIAHIWTVWA